MAVAQLDFTAPASEATIVRTAEGLRARGFEVIIAETGAEARQRVLQLIPEGAEVMTASSVTLESTGLLHDLNDSGRYDSIKAKTLTMDRATEGKRIRQIVAAPDYHVGSVHAVTEDGVLLVASGSGSQVAGYLYGAERLILVVGAQKIVPTLVEGVRRVEEHSYQLEDQRFQKAYGRNASLNKLVQFRRDMPGRTTVVLVKEPLGF